MSFCENCGNNVSDTSKFCSNCGEKVNYTTLAITIPPEETKPQWSLEKFLVEYPPNDKGIITCPRCMGKGNVDIDDIERLSMKLFWNPGECLYCDGVGLVNIKKTAEYSITDELGLTDIQRKNLQTLSELIDEKLEENDDLFGDGWSASDMINKFFGHLSSNPKIYLEDNIPKDKLQSFIKKIKNSFEDEIIENGTYYVYFDASGSLFGNANKGLLLLFENGTYYLYVINPSSAGYWRIPLLNQQNIKIINSKLILSNPIDGDIIVDFPNSNSLFEAIVEFYKEYKVDISLFDPEEFDEDVYKEDESPIQPKDGAGIR